jgi:hypothetical protein
MADKFKGTWYVSFEPPRGKRNHARMTETFPNEREAKQFARAKLVDTRNVSAGTSTVRYSELAPGRFKNLWR